MQEAAHHPTISFSCSVMIPARDSPVKNILNTRCCCHVICFSTPPQEQGRCLANSNMYKMYAVNTIIRIKEMINPVFRNCLTVSIEAVINSVTGNTMATGFAYSLTSGDLLN